MVISQADMFVPGWNELMLAMARRSVSCRLKRIAEGNNQKTSTAIRQRLK
jgi:hypothetical protein